MRKGAGHDEWQTFGRHLSGLTCLAWMCKMRTLSVDSNEGSNLMLHSLFWKAQALKVLETHLRELLHDLQETVDL